MQYNLSNCIFFIRTRRNKRKKLPPSSQVYFKLHFQYWRKNERQTEKAAETSYRMYLGSPSGKPLSQFCKIMWKTLSRNKYWLYSILCNSLQANIYVNPELNKTEAFVKCLGLRLSLFKWCALLFKISVLVCMVAKLARNLLQNQQLFQKIFLGHFIPLKWAIFLGQLEQYRKLAQASNQTVKSSQASQNSRYKLRHWHNQLHRFTKKTVELKSNGHTVKTYFMQVSLLSLRTWHVSQSKTL